MSQFQAGFCIDKLNNLFSKKDFDEKINPILHNLSFFDVKTTSNFDKKIKNSEVTLVNNQITGGLPFGLSPFMEDVFSQTFSQTKKSIDQDGNIEWNFINDELKELIFKSIHIIKPGKSKNFSEDSKTKKEKFITEVLTKDFQNKIDESFIQLLTKGTSYIEFFKQLLMFQNIQNTHDIKDFENDIFDLIISFPYLIKEKRGIIFEFDESDDVRNIDYLKFEKKKKILDSVQYSIVRIKKDQVESGIQEILSLTYNEYFEIIKKNYKTPIYNRETGRDALQLTLTPFGIARIQKIIIEFILSGNLELSAKEWNIAIIERDIPCAFFAIEDLNQKFQNIDILTYKKTLPKINLSIYYSEEFQNSKLNVLYFGEKEIISNFDQKKQFDLLIDISILQKSNESEENIKSVANHFVSIRSSNQILSKRKVYYSDLISYLPSEITETNKENVESALTYFLKTFFKKQDFRPNQIQAICEVLRQNSTLHITLPTNDEQLIWQFAALMQPALSIVFHPQTLLMKRQFKKLRTNKIESTFYINSSQKKVWQKQEVIRQITDNEASIIFISPEQLYNEDFRTTIENIQSQNVNFGYLIFEQAQCSSQYSFDFNVKYSQTYELARKFFQDKNQNETTVIALSSIISYDVLTDLKEKLNIKDKFVLINKNNELINVSFKGVTTTKTENVSDLEFFLRKSNSNKIELIEKILNKPIDSKNLIICADKSICKELEINLIKNNPNIKLYSFTGSYDQEINSLKGNEAEISEKNYFEFVQNKKNTLVSVDSISTGLNLENIEKTILFNVPNSPQAIYSAIGKYDKILNQFYIIYDKSVRSLTEYTDIAQADGTLETIEEAAVISGDVILQRRKIEKIYPGRKKELSIINELLNKIRIPKFSASQNVISKVFEEFGENVILVSQPLENPYQIIVTKGKKNFGLIDFKKSTINIEHSDFKEDISYQILEFIRYEALKYYPYNNTFFKNFEMIHQASEIDGIETKLLTLKEGKTSEIEFFTTNNTINEIVELLSENVSQNFTFEIIKQEIEKNTFHKDFIKALGKVADINIVDKRKDIPIQIENLFYKSRNESQTFIALSRLKTIGIIDDFIVNNSSGKIKVLFTNKKDDLYKIQVFKILENFFSHEKAISFYEQLTTYSGNTILQKCVRYFLNTFYDYYIERQYDWIEITNGIFKTITESKIKDDEINNHLLEYFDNLPEAKYKSKIFKPSLFLDTDSLKKSNFGVTMKYILKTNDSLDEREHVLKSTQDLLIENPENYSLLLLNSYMNLWKNYKNEEVFDKVFENLNKGFLLMEEQEDLSLSEILNCKTLLINELYKRDIELYKLIEPLIYLKTHVVWLEEFNKHFLEGFSN